MGAMPEEIDSIIQLLSEESRVTIGMRTYSIGKLNGITAVVVFSRWGKVAASITVSTLILEFKVTELIFTGVAGAIDPQLRIGDIVLGRRLIQHDMDARPLMEQFEIPLLGKTFFESAAEQLELAAKDFGLKNAESTYQRMMTKMFEPQLGRSIEVYIDDMVVKSKVVSEHVGNLANIFEILRKHKLHLNASKCSFGVGSGMFLGYMVTHRGIEVNPYQIKAINKLQPP